MNVLKKFDWILIGSIILLLTIGLLSIASASQARNSTFVNFNKQLIFAFLGAALFLIFSFLDYRIFRNYSFVVLALYFFIVFLLLILVFFGAKTRGAASWFNFGLFNVEPSELAKFVLIVTLAKYFSTRHVEFGLFRHIVISGFYTFVPTLLVLLQPDLGSALLLVIIWAGIMFFAGIRAKHLLILLSVFAVIAGLSWQFLLKDYQRARITTFLKPQKDPFDRGYNVMQSVIAVGSGRIFGKGLGHGTQSQLNFLPEQHTDFIFATIAEEWGLLGVLLVFLLFNLIFWRLAYIGARAPNNFARLFIWGLWLTILGHFIINVGMNIGVAPITGISLPFLSYGGSNLIATLLSFGVVNNIRINSV